MIKRFLGILTVLIMLFCLVFSFFLKLGENANFSKTPIDYFPKNPVFLMGINEITKTFDHFTSTSMIWSKMENDFIDKGTLNLNQQFLKVLSNKDSSLISYFNRGKTFIGVYEISDSTHWIIGKNIYDSTSTFQPAALKISRIRSDSSLPMEIDGHLDPPR